ncbi:hypothetical protein [Bosea sp. BK604]|uniref:hypothetical protein n=1 Tax=Bosea sp. BK604 TaxID=2512180 RepID=UPI00104561B7|nr:hypothetical protein [Bosea sp. BK604]
MPAWRVELQRVTTPEFLEVCEAYELVWDAIMAFERIDATDQAAEFRELADFLEVEALSIALQH